MMSQRKVKVARDLTVIARYFVKKPGTVNGVHYTSGSIVLLVRNDAGKECLVTIRPNGVHSCGCDAYAEDKGRGKRQCYHVTYGVKLEQEREEVAAKIVDALYTLTIEVKKKPLREIIPAGERAPLKIAS
jgi:hypothetical protein